MQTRTETTRAIVPGDAVRPDPKHDAWPRKAEEVAELHLREREERARKERARFDLD